MAKPSDSCRWVFLRITGGSTQGQESLGFAREGLRESKMACGWSMSQITRILHDLEQRRAGAADELMALVYDELRKLAAAKLAQEKPGQTLQATALVHEAYLRLVGWTQAQRWDSRGHFFAAAAEAMRRILVEHARRKQPAQARRRPARGSTSTTPTPAADDPADDLLALDEALTGWRPRIRVKAELVKLRYFAGLTLEEAAEPWASPRRPPTGTGRTPGPGCARALRTHDPPGGVADVCDKFRRRRMIPHCDDRMTRYIARGASHDRRPDRARGTIFLALVGDRRAARAAPT